MVSAFKNDIFSKEISWKSDEIFKTKSQEKFASSQISQVCKKITKNSSFSFKNQFIEISRHFFNFIKIQRTD